MAVQENPTNEQIKKEGYLAKELSIMEHLAVGQCRKQVLGNGNIYMPADGAFAKIDGVNKTREICRSISKIPKLETENRLKGATQIWQFGKIKKAMTYRRIPMSLDEESILLMR